MNKKIKVLLIFLGIVSLSGLALAVWIYFSAQVEVNRYVRQQTVLEQKNTQLQKELNSIQQEIDNWKRRSESTTAALNKLGKEHLELQAQYAALLRVKDSLLKGNQDLSAQLGQLKSLYSQAQQIPTIDASNEFLTSLLEEKARLQVKIDNLKDEIRHLERQASPTQEKFVQLEREKSDVERKFKDSEKVSTILSSDLLEEKKKRMALENELTDAESRLGNIVSEKDRLADQLDKMKQALEQRLMELNKTKQFLEGAVQDVDQAVRRREPTAIELSPIVVRAEGRPPQAKPVSPPQAKPVVVKTEKAKNIYQMRAPESEPVQPVAERFKLSGRVIKVNDKYRFIVIDIGRDDGVEKGMNFSIFRNDEKVGTVQVIETRQNIAACDIKQKNARGFKLNDIARH